MLKMMAGQDWHILNGNIEGDEDGEYTYIEKRGKSVIDYVVTNTVGIDKVLNFRIKDRVESDHQSLNVMTRGRCYSEEKKGRIKEVVCWKPESVQKYEETTESKIFEDKEDTNKDWERLKGAIECQTHSGQEMEDRAKILVEQRVQ